MKKKECRPRRTKDIVIDIMNQSDLRKDLTPWDGKREPEFETVQPWDGKTEQRFFNN
jgi:hypothetical protein